MQNVVTALRVSCFASITQFKYILPSRLGMHDYVHFNSKIIGHETQNNWNRFEVDRIDMIRQCILIINRVSKKVS